jgi:uncharacterized membrane protein YgcG
VIFGCAALGIVLVIGGFWAASQRQSSGTFSADGYTIQRSFVADWLLCSAKVLGFVIFVLGVLAMASSKSSSSSRSWGGSSSSSGGSSSGGSGWSGGGASSSW